MGMKTVIYYYSKNNHTKNYADSLANRIVCETHNYKSMKAKEMLKYDTIIFMAPVYNNKIRHVDKFLKLYPRIKTKNLIIVAVGMQMPNPERRETIIITNLLNDYHIRLYELMGGFDANKLPFIMRKMMQAGLKIAMKRDPNLQANANRVNDLFKFPFEYNDVNGIEKIMNTIHRLERENIKS